MAHPILIRIYSSIDSPKASARVAEAVITRRQSWDYLIKKVNLARKTQ